MSVKPSSDWIDAFPEEPDVPSRKFPPARVRKRTASAATSNGTVGLSEAASTPSKPSAGPTDGENSPANASETASYAVGYCKPPRHSQFQPGRSGNPRGRQKGAKSLNSLVRETLGARVAVRTATGTKKISRIEVVLQKTVEQAMKGNPKAQAELIRLWRSAVPDERFDEAVNQEENLTAADLAMLEAYRHRLDLPEERHL